jgi:hypothetical protein
VSFAAFRYEALDQWRARGLRASSFNLAEQP